VKKIGRFTKVFAVGFTLFFFVLTHPRFIGVDSAGVFSRFQFSWQDFLFQHTTTALKSGDPRLLLIAVDAESGKKFGFPLPRAVYGRMLDALKTLGVRTVVFDVMFFEPREGDAELAAATKRFGRVIHLFAQEEQLTSHGTVTTTSLPIDPS
jgi:CHASE2 domain-containing sensor protein